MFVYNYPLPTPATYPNGAGTPKKCLLLRVDNEPEGTAIVEQTETLKLHLFTKAVSESTRPSESAKAPLSSYSTI